MPNRPPPPPCGARDLSLAQMLASFASSFKVKLDAWNEGYALQGVRVRKKSGDVVLGLVDRQTVLGLNDGQTTAASIALRIADKYLPVHIPMAEIEAVEQVPETPLDAHGFRTVHKGLGGVGPHIRRCMFPDSEQDEVGGFVNNVNGRIHELRILAASLETVTFFFDDDDVDAGVVPCILPGRFVPHFVAFLAESQFTVFFPNVRRASLMADSLNRAPHQYGQQLKYMKLADVGCTRSFWRFKFAHMPESDRRGSCFSWPAWAQNVADEIEKEDASVRIHELELPLRAYVQIELLDRQQRRSEELVAQIGTTARTVTLLRRLQPDLDVEAARLGGLVKAYSSLANRGVRRFACEARVLGAALVEIEEEVRMLRDRIRAETLNNQAAEGAMRATRTKRCLQPLSMTDPTYFVMRPLSDEQSSDAINAFHAFYYANGRLSDDERNIKRAKLQHYPQTTGYYVHWTSAYKLSDENIGNGEELRYAVDMSKLSNTVKNKLRVMPDGTVRGKGKQAYKGRFDHERAYDPKRQLLRTKLHEREMREPPPLRF